MMTCTHFGLWILLAGVVVLSREADSLRGSALVAELKAKAKAALLNPTETVEEVLIVDGDLGNSTTVNGTATNVTITKTKSLLTGNPQKDYIYDPNLPRELNGYNLTNYPFYNGVPDDIDFKCDDLHDGFYASVPHKCQVYHHCLFGTRYDFLCANYTAFDQRTFICHFVSEVDCDNSPKFYQRNEALYKAASTSPPLILSTTTTTTTTTTSSPPPQRPRRRRPYRRRRPVYEYFYDDQYDEEEYYDDDPPPPPPSRKNNRKHRPQGGYREDDDEYYDGRRGSPRGDSSRSESSRSGSSRAEDSSGSDSGGDSFKEAKPTVRVSGPAAGTVYDRPRVPPKIRRPVPINEREKYDYTKKASDSGPLPMQETKKTVRQQTKVEEDDDEYYDEEYEDDYEKPPPKRTKLVGDYSSESGGKSDSRRPNSRPRPRPHSRRRPDHYESDYEDERPMRPRKRLRHEDPPQMSRGNRGNHRGYSRDDSDAVPADRPGFISSGRLSSGGRKRNDEDRSQLSTKKLPGRVTYEDEDDDGDYYDYEEEENHDDHINRRNHRPTSNSGSNGRHSEEHHSENGRKTNRKQMEDTVLPKQTPQDDIKQQTLENRQGDLPQGKNGNTPNRSNFDVTPLSKGESAKEQCKYDCEDDYSDYPNSKEEGKVLSESSNQKSTNDKEINKKNSERDRVFSSRFRETQNEQKSKQYSYDSTGLGRGSLPPSNYRTAQSSESSFRPKATSRTKVTVDETSLPTTKPTTTTSTTTTTPPSLDYSNESSTSKYINFRSKGRIIPPTPLVDNYKKLPTTEQSYEVSENSQDSETGTFFTEAFMDAIPEKAISPRPFSGSPRRPIKVTTESVALEDIPVVSQKSPFIGLNYRQISSVNGDDDIIARKTPVSGQNYRRTKNDPPQVENIDYNQQTISSTGSNFRRPGRPIDEIKSDESSYSEDDRESTLNGGNNARSGVKPSFPDKTQLVSNYGGAYRRVKISAISTTTPEMEVSTSVNETPQSSEGSIVQNPVNSYKRPFLVARPLANFPVVVEDTTKNTLPLNGPFRRPAKQRIQSTEASDEFNPTSGISSSGEGYRKEESGPNVNLRPNLGYFPSKRGKLRLDDNTQRGIQQFPKQLPTNPEDQFSKQSPKIEITAPGPSAPDADVATVKNNYKNEFNSGPPGFTLDIPEEEYDVTLNDALQPSTLHPTRSVGEYQQARLKTRDYQRSPEFRGRVQYLIPAASQQYITRVQSLPITASYTSDKNVKKSENLDHEEYDAVVLTTSGDQWPNQRRNRPTEWYW